MDGGSAENAGAIFGRPPWMARVPKMQEQFSVTTALVAVQGSTA
jgi:hypothetical protein